jgi:hypothetical protein
MRINSLSLSLYSRLVECPLHRGSAPHSPKLISSLCQLLAQSRVSFWIIDTRYMLGVAKALSLVMAESPANAADLLSEDFEYSTPFSGPLKKKKV